MRLDCCHTLVGALLFLVAVIGFSAPASGQHMGNFSYGSGLHEEESRFLPGLYYFHKGCDYNKLGQIGPAIQAWKLSAGWAMKEAQYDLGIAYFKGLGIAADRPRGLAWLALAAERKDPRFQDALAVAWANSSPNEHDRANTLWRDLRRRYGDEVALPRGRIHFNNEVNQITGSRVGVPGHVVVWTRNTGTVDGASFRAQLERLAQTNFGKMPIGQVEVEPIRPISDDVESGQEYR